MVVGQQCPQAFGDQFVAGRRPMSAIAVGIAFGSIEGNERYSLGLQVLDQFSVAVLESDKQPRAMGFDEFAYLAYDPLRRIGHI